MELFPCWHISYTILFNERLLRDYACQLEKLLEVENKLRCISSANCKGRLFWANHFHTSLLIFLRCFHAHLHHYRAQPCYCYVKPKTLEVSRPAPLVLFFDVSLFQSTYSSELLSSK